MKNEKINTITLKKLTIARITMTEMNQVKGGSSSPTTDEFYDTHIQCNDSDTF
ncbi:class I lanthipeptide [Aquimarina sp. BL5]|uniref:class I lanthipeptide n=1 Tax=Aquimarina sp. BL5 TaxID=1714860 RepID=UPI0013146747|nr:class I lanthipeptide [Aquimarina sp. BL5]